MAGADQYDVDFLTGRLAPAVKSFLAMGTSFGLSSSLPWRSWLQGWDSTTPTITGWLQHILPKAAAQSMQGRWEARTAAPDGSFVCNQAGDTWQPICLQAEILGNTCHLDMSVLFSEWRTHGARCALVQAPDILCVVSPRWLCSTSGEWRLINQGKTPTTVHIPCFHAESVATYNIPYQLMSVVMHGASGDPFGARYWASSKKTGWHAHTNGKIAKPVKLSDTTLYARDCDAVFLCRVEESVLLKTERCERRKSLINDTVTVSEKPITHSIDEIALLINTLSSAARKKNLNALYGKTADLKGAYRQLAVSDTSLDFSYLAVYDPAEEKPKLFQQLAVPFGSTKAVYFFLRVARALWTILVKGAKIPTTNYFDDFVLLALGGDRSSCSHAFDEVMKLLGWKLSADKTTEWNTSFEALGVLFELDQTGSGVLKVKNTEKRRKELTGAIKGFLDKGTMTQKEALQLRGRLQFAQAQFFGRLGRRCLTEVTKHAYTGRSKLSSMAKERLEEFGKFLDMAQPRLVGQVSCRTFMILTDAAFETESGTGGLGGVLLTGSGSALSFFSVPISEQQAKSMSLQDEHTIIYELEMFGVLIGLKLLVEKTAAFAESYEQPGAVAGTGVICYIDNDAARHAYIAGSSKKGVAGILIDEVNFLEYVHGILPWYARVASPANLADEPSRMKLDRVKRLGFKDESVEATKAVLSIVKRASNLPA
ncbi:pol [Symbiodinium sp. CCMP2592]|nr:pol [Symbiodinium sp. CCMP2592]